MNNYSFTPFFKKLFTLTFSITLIFIGISNANATHLIGGNVGYTYIGPNPNIAGEILYKISLDAYQDCNSPSWGGVFPEVNITVGIYEGVYSPTNAINNYSQVSLTLMDSNQVDANLPPICDPHSLLQNLCVYLTRYEATISVPASNLGYWVIYDRCCRPGGIRNLSNSDDQSFVYSTWIPAVNGVLINNSTAQFTDTLLSYICRTDTAYISNTAIDPDGDSLVYSLETPFIGLTGNGMGGNNQPILNYTLPTMNPYTIPPAGVIYAPGYHLANLLGATSFSSVESLSTQKYPVR